MSSQQRERMSRTCVLGYLCFINRHDSRFYLHTFSPLLSPSAPPYHYPWHDRPLICFWHHMELCNISFIMYITFITIHKYAHPWFLSLPSLTVIYKPPLNFRITFVKHFIFHPMSIETAITPLISPSSSNVELKRSQSTTVSRQKSLNRMLSSATRRKRRGRADSESIPNKEEKPLSRQRSLSELMNRLTSSFRSRSVNRSPKTSSFSTKIEDYETYRLIGKTC